MLEIQNVTCGYGSDPILRDISMKVGTGEFVAILGPNGSGKTTLMRAVSRVIRPTKGLISFDGQNIKDLSFGEFARIVAVVTNLQDTDLPMSVEEFVLLGRIPHRAGLGLRETRKDLSRTQSAMDLTGTLQLRERRVDTLSSGEKQMVSIARALAQEPRLLLLDEPTSHLDIAHQIRVMDLISRLNREETLTVITVVHDLNLAGEYGDRLLLMKEGSIVKDGTPRQVLTQEIVEDVYATPVVVLENPLTAKPHVCQLPSQSASRTNKFG